MEIIAIYAGNVMKYTDIYTLSENADFIYLKKRVTHLLLYRGTDKSLDGPTSRCILFDGENISFDASLVLYIYIYIYIVLIFLQL